jgi:tetratricopeptide (TPR) repeat protein
MHALPDSRRSGTPRLNTIFLFGVALLLLLVPAADPVLAQGGLEQGIKAFENGQFEEAENLLRSMVEADEDNHAALYYLGRTCLALQQKKEAVELLEKAVELDPGEVTYHKWLARAYNSYAMQLGQIRALIMGLTKKIIREFETIIELDPGAASERMNLVMIYYFLPGLFGGDKDRTFELIDEQKRIDPREGAYTMAELQIEIGNDDEALQECQSYLRTSPGDIRMRNQLGRVYHAMERWDDAFGIFEEVIKDAPEDLYAYYLIGRSAGSSGLNLERGTKCLEFFIGHTGVDEEGLPSHADAHWRVGLIREKQGETGAARTEYEKALELDPDHPYAKSALKRVRRR